MAEKWEEELGLASVAPLDRPMTAGPNDRWVGEDELGNKMYETPTGQRYSIRPASEEESKTTRAKVEDWIDEGAPLPTWDQIVESAKAMPGAIYDSAYKAVRGEGTVGDALGFVPATGAIGTASRIGEAFDPSIVSAMGASPRWKSKEAIAAKTPPKEDLFSKYGISSRTLKEFDGNLNSTTLYDVGGVTDTDLGNASYLEGEVLANLSFRDVWEQDYAGNPYAFDQAAARIARNAFYFDNLDENQLLEKQGEIRQLIDKHADKVRENYEYQEFLTEAQKFSELSDAEQRALTSQLEESYFEGPSDFTVGAIQYRSPLLEVFEEAEFPKDGLKGSAILKEIQDNPDIRVAEFKALGVNIDPQRRYTKDEVLGLFKDYNYKVTTKIENRWGSYQRQDDLNDLEKDYFEVVIDAERDNKPFKPSRGTHFNDSTIAHGRVSVREDPQGKDYGLVEELQSDLLQHGYLKPAEEKELYEVLNNTLSQVGDKENLLFTSNMPTIASNFSKAYQESMEKAFKGASIEEVSEAIDDWIKETYHNPENVKTKPAYDPEDPFADDRLVDLEFEPLEDGIPPFEPERQSFHEVRNTVNFYMEDALKDSKGNVPYALARGWEIALYDTIQDYNTAKGVGDVLRDTSNKLREITPNVGLPPILRTEESVTATMDAIIAEMAGRGVTRIIIPPQDKIVEKRFSRDSAGFAKAMDPKSGFTATYNKALNAYIKKLEKEFGSNAVTIRQVPMNYAAKTKNPIQKRVATGTLSNILRTGRLDSSGDLSVEIITNNYAIIDRFSDGVATEKDADWLSNLASDVANSVDDADNAELLYNEMLNRLTALQGERNGFKALEEVVADFYGQPQQQQVMGTEIDFTGLVEQDYDLSRPKFAKGGMVEQPTMDPVSKNPVPPGATPEEVRDDVPIMASEGEYVIPANVVRYLGLDRIEKLVNQAKKGLAELEQKGRIGGQTKDDLPFSAEELQVLDEEAPVPTGTPRMATGGMVKSPDPNAIDPETGLPYWMLRKSPRAPIGGSSGRSEAEREADKPTGLAASVSDWTPAEFNKYAEARGSVDQKVGQALASFVPFGGLASRVRERYLERTVPQEMMKMIESGVDLQGNPLSTEQLDQLRESYSRIGSEPLSRIGGISGVAKAVAEESGLIKPRKATVEQVEDYNERVRGDSLINRGIDSLTKSSSTSKSSSDNDGVVQIGNSIYRGVQRRSEDDTMDKGDGPAYSSSETSGSTAPSTSQRPKANPFR